MSQYGCKHEFCTVCVKLYFYVRGSRFTNIVVVVVVVVVVAAVVVVNLLPRFMSVKAKSSQAKPLLYFHVSMYVFVSKSSTYFCQCTLFTSKSIAALFLNVHMKSSLANQLLCFRQHKFESIAVLIFLLARIYSVKNNFYCCF